MVSSKRLSGRGLTSPHLSDLSLGRGRGGEASRVPYFTSIPRKGSGEDAVNLRVEYSTVLYLLRVRVDKDRYLSLLSGSLAELASLGVAQALIGLRGP